MKKIAIMTSGGDAPGMNAAIYELYRKALKKGFEVYFIKDAFKGLVENSIFKVTKNKEDKIYLKQASIKGGTILGSVRYKEFEKEENQIIAKDNLKKLGIYNLVVLGGNGSFKGALALSTYGINVQGIPVTIDNDLYYSQYSIGFMTAVNTVVESIDKIRDTMTSHHRLCLVECMGNKCGELALYAGIYGNADVVFIPELYSSTNQLIDIIKNKINSNNEIHIALVSEALGHVDKLIDDVKKEVNVDIRATNLGHVQRGGNPVSYDIELAKAFANQVLYNIEYAIYNKAVGISDNKTFSIPLEDVDLYKNHNDSLTLQNFLNLAKELNR